MAKLKRRKEGGVALLITLFAILIMIFLAVEIGYNTHVELKVGAAQVDRLRAYYLARAGVQLSILRINAYHLIASQFGQALGANKSDLDLIWQFPFQWPPIVPKDISSVDKDEIQSAVKKSTIDGAFSTTIETESGKININDLASPSQAIQQATTAQLVNLIQNRINAQDEFAENHQNLRPLELINNIADWIDEDDISRNGGNEESYYQNTDPPIKPPNRPFKSLEELHMVAGMTDDIYNLLLPKITLWGEKGINVNYASKEVLRSLDPQVTDQVADAIIEHRGDSQKGPFSAESDFDTFLQGEGVNIKTFDQNPHIPLLFDTVANFRIKSSGIYGKAQREIVAIVYDFGKVKSELSAAMATASATPSATPNGPPGQTPPQTAGASPSPTPTASGAPSSGPPQIVFWQEF